MSAPSPQLFAGQVTTPDYTLPTWAQDHLHLALWDRAAGPETPIFRAGLNGRDGTFQAVLADPAVLPGQGQPPRLVASIGWGAALDPVLVHLSWPGNWQAGLVAAPPSDPQPRALSRADRPRFSLGWAGIVSVIGHVEQMHVQEVGGLALAVLEVSGYAVPVTYRRLPPLPLNLDDPHRLHTDRRLDDAPEQGFYLLADAESPLAALAQDALVSALRIVAVASLGTDEAGWDEVINLPLVLDALTLIGP